MIKILYKNVSVFKDPEIFRQHYLEMPEYRKNKIDRLKLDKDKYLSLGAGILLNKALDSAGIKNKNMPVSCGEHGKPYLPGIADRFRFNLSHSGEMVMCVFNYSEDGDALSVGCDIEKTGRPSLRTAERFFCRQEFETILSCETQEEQDEMFYRLWTLKESFIKATGAGMSLPLNEFNITISSSGISAEQTADSRRFVFGEEIPCSGYRAAWCYAQKVT